METHTWPRVEYDIQFITNDAGKIVSFLYRSRKYLARLGPWKSLLVATLWRPWHQFLLYLCKSQISSKMEYCFHIRTGAAQSSLSKPDKVQRSLCGRWIILHPTAPFPTNETLLRSRYFHDRCSGELESFIRPVQTLEATNPHDTYTVLTPLHSFHIPLVRRRFYSEIFLPRIVPFWDGFSRRYLHGYYNLKLFKPSVKLHLF